MVALVANIVPILLVDRVGRRLLILVSVTGSVSFKLIFAVVVGKKSTPNGLRCSNTAVRVQCTDIPPLFFVLARCQGRGLAGRVVVVVVGGVCSSGNHDRV